MDANQRKRLERRVKISGYLLWKGFASVREICRELGIPRGSLPVLLSDRAFTCGHNGKWSLTGEEPEISATMDWDEYFMRMAQLASEKSKDASTKVGVVIVGKARQVVSTGFNGFPMGASECVPKRHERPAKYDWTEHAELNAIFLAARHGISLEGCVMYCPWSPSPCVKCCRGIIQSGIQEIVVLRDKEFSGKLDCQFDSALRMLREGKVKIRICDVKL